MTTPAIPDGYEPCHGYEWDEDGCCTGCGDEATARGHDMEREPPEEYRPDPAPPVDPVDSWLHFHEGEL